MLKNVLKISALTLAVSTLFLFASCSTNTQTEETTTTEEPKEEEKADEPEAPASPRMQIEEEMAGTTVVVDWGSPGVKERTIWGDLVPWGEVWRAGANQTTYLEFAADVNIGGTAVSAGKYGMLILPNENADWTVIITTQWDRDEHGIWGSMGYEEGTDVVRVDVTPTWAEESSERLEYAVDGNNITFAWEKARLSIPLSPAE